MLVATFCCEGFIRSAGGRTGKIFTATVIAATAPLSTRDMASFAPFLVCLMVCALACMAAPAEDLKTSAAAPAASDLKAESSYGLGYGIGPWGGYGGFGYPGYHGYGYPYRHGWYPGYHGLGYGGYGFGGYPWY